MAKKKEILFECQACGLTSAKWQGRCSNCNAWDSFIELKSDQIEFIKESKSQNSSTAKPTSITEISEDVFTRFSTGEEEFDLTLGGGVVEGGLYLIGGSPGVGKSTLLLKVASNVSKAYKDESTLYVSGEESAAQISHRAKRLNSLSQNLFLLSEVDFKAIKNAILSAKYKLVIIDSIQTIYNADSSTAVGSVSQIKDITFELLRIAKASGTTIFIIGHITKDGAIAGPRILEHMVDCVLYFEGEKSSSLRLLRGFKNRFGATDEIGIFEMNEGGLISTKSASRLFFNNLDDAIGQSFTVIMEGSRAIVVEIQALVVKSVAPRRQCSGYDLSRLNMLLAILEKKLNLPLNQYDVFINIAGGMKIKENSADLCVIACILSSLKNRTLKKDSAFIGEVSLIGDIRSASRLENRLNELASLGFKNVILSGEIDKKLPLKLHNIRKLEELVSLM